MKPKVAILYVDGINRDQETIFAFQKAGADTELIHLNELINKEKKLSDYQIMALPGGFAHGDAIISGKVYANKILNRLPEEIGSFLKEDKLVIGICNGFQILVRTGILPFNNFGGDIEAALIDNNIGHLESRWVKLKVESSNCIFTRGMEGSIIEVPISHGEGKFTVNPEILKKLEDSNQVIFRYVDDEGNVTQEFPANPNGAMNAISGITDPSGKILGLMPHPECNTQITHHPNWQNFPEDKKEADCLKMFKNAVEYFG